MIISLRNSLLIYLILLLEFISPNNHAQSITFNHLTVENGLSNNVVNTVIQDKTGFMWFATADGLNRYDGYGFKIFRHDSENSNSISDNNIWSLTEDRQGNIWIGTKEGVLDRYNPETEIFTHWEIKSDLTEENSITSIYEDSKGNIWIGTYKDGIYKLNPETNKMDHWGAKTDDKNILSHNYVHDIGEDDSGNILVGTHDGLNIFNPDLPQDGFEKFFFNPDNRKSLSNNLIWGISKSTLNPDIIWICARNNLTKFDSEKLIFERVTISNPDHLQYGTSVNSVVEEIDDNEVIIWAASYSGLIRINFTSGITKRFVQDELNVQSLSSNQINKIIKDRTGVLWVATENGVSYSTPKSTSFNSITLGNNASNIISVLKKKNITAISKFDDDRIWIGTANGLYLLDDIENNPQFKMLDRFDGIHIWSLATTSVNKDEVWIGTYGKGLKQFNFIENKVFEWDVKDPKIRTQSVYYNKSLLEDSKKNIWIGYWGVGAARINPLTGKSNVWMNEPGNSKSISHNDVWVIKEDRFGRIWLGTLGGGLNLFEDREDGIFHHWLQSDIKNGLSSNNIFSICEAINLKNSNTSVIVLWIGTSDGLNRLEVKNSSNAELYNLETSNQLYTVKDGLPDNSVNSIIEDDKGNLWLGTGSGITFFDVRKKTFTNFTKADGINGLLMNTEAAIRLDNNLTLFGSTKGLNIFNPNNVKMSIAKPNVVITDFQIFNKSVKIGSDSPLNQSVAMTDRIVLSHDQDVFSFEFAALDYNSSHSIKYAYKMEGFDREWIESGNRRFVTYTNLDPGEYIFKIKSTNSDGVWNDQVTSLNIIMKPPWWKTLWAYILYVVLIILGLIGIRRFELNRARLRNALKLREYEVKKKSELEETKSRFFANLSHEFRTPLMLIRGPLEQLKKGEIYGDNSENIDLIERNSDRLKELIDQLLELSQLEKASISLKTKKEDVVAILKGLSSSFEYLAMQKNISTSFESNTETKLCWLDRDKFEKIINNLLSNAFKFTAKGGEVFVKAGEIIKKDKHYVEIKISDTGVSIPKDKIDKIFDRFFQVDDSAHRSYGGSGIGLALVKEFVELHKWSISVDSEHGKGTEFTLLIPMWDDYLNEYEKLSAESMDDLKTLDLKKSGLEKSDHYQKVKQDKSSLSDSDNKPAILIVDDSKDVRTYLSDLLMSKYKISEAANGEEGIISATEKMPDLIISDIMMPSMDGMEFCRRIKTEWQTSDIPVILLTAKASTQSRIEGLEIGADDYLTKPFDSKELFTRIKNLLEQRKRLRDKYNKYPEALTETDKLNEADNDFLNKFMELVNSNLDKTNFGTEQLARELFVSRTQLHRRMLAVTGQAPGEFIRIIKLKRAAKLILDGKFSVTQVAYEIGFSSPAQFTRAFSKQFNCVPSEYPSRQKK